MQEHPKQLIDRIKKYAKQCRPKTGWENDENINHFQLLNHLAKSNDKYKTFAVTLSCEENKTKILALIDGEFNKLFPKLRIDLIKKCIEIRFNIINELLKS